MDLDHRPTQLVFFPYPLQGHLTPMLQLAQSLLSLNPSFKITIAHTHFNSPKIESPLKFTLIPIDDGLPVNWQPKGGADLLKLVDTISSNCRAPLFSLLSRLNEEDPVAGFFYDGIMGFAGEVGTELGLKAMAFRTSSATSFAVFANIEKLHEMGYLPIRDFESEERISELPPLRIKDLPAFSSDNSVLESFWAGISQLTKQTKKASALILNSLSALENEALKMIQHDFHIPIYAIGPLNCQISLNLLPEDSKCLSWLDAQPPKSVIYTSFGSLAGMDSSQVAEIAWGLANSGCRFLWVVRPGSVNGYDAAELPSGFMDQVGSRGLVVGWAPQKDVLAHQAVGAFWTHCGWNSTLESLCAAVPMACWARFGDQKVNSRLACGVWRVGLEMGREVERGEVERVLRRLLMEREGEEMRERGRELMQVLESSLEKGGSSYEAFEALVNKLKS
ncbi:hypothetical protein AMTRI_Chr08g202760 [Amborella trichopoda]